MEPSFAPSGISHFPQVRWGSHMANLFAAGAELREVLIPYFKAGLENHERCLWVTGPELNADAARAALRAALPDLDARERAGQIDIRDGNEWYAAAQRLGPDELMRGLLGWEQGAIDLGYKGLRASGNCSWVTHRKWPHFRAFERQVQKDIRGRRMICLCSYCVDQVPDVSHLDLMQCHDVVMPSSHPPRQSAPR